MFATGLGHETPSMLASICAFMFGMALGAWLFDGRIERSKFPGRWYAALELVIGAWALLSITLIPIANSVALKLIGVNPSALRHWFVAFAIPTIALLPATAAMGATFPAMERFLTSLATHRSVAIVYAANTFGTVAGILLSTFVIAPRIGFSFTVATLGTINLLCGVAAWFLFKRTSRNVATRDQRATNPELTRHRLLVTMVVTGLLGIGYEVTGTRVLSQVLENTIYTFAAVLSIYLLGTALGAALYHRCAAARKPTPFLGVLVASTALACMCGVFALSRAQQLYDFARQLGDSIIAVLSAEMFVAAAVFLAPTICMGATFAHVVQLLRNIGVGTGRAIALNTFAGALASAIFGIALVPALGSKWTLVIVAAGYATLTPRFNKAALSLVAASVGLILFLPANLHIVNVPPGGRVVSFQEGVMGAVAVVEDAQDHRVLRVN
ncbi:MAG TPA: hypothetical protein VK530_01650, partial [Candidatus Acidoferrum sp.]|nr:hypothetical protein [Candidatus Acidoferrum sp.]